MSEAYGLRDLGGSAEVAARVAKPGMRGRRGLRIALLSIAVAILLLGAAIAGIFGYRAINGGRPASAVLHLQRVPRANGGTIQISGIFGDRRYVLRGTVSEAA